MNHKDYMNIISDAMTCCRCDEATAQNMLNRVINMGSDPRAFVDQLPQLIGEAIPNADEVIRLLDAIAEDNGSLKNIASLTFPAGYENRAARRRKERQTKNNRPRPIFKKPGRGRTK